jgi:large subunit ribosomal protein L28e
LSSHKYSGLANSKVRLLDVDSFTCANVSFQTVDISANADGAIVITTNKKDAKPNQVAGAKQSTTLRRSTGTRRAAKIAAAATAGKGYRADLRHVSVMLVTFLPYVPAAY